MSEEPSLSVLDRSTVRSLRLESPLPHSVEGWQRFAQALHHACLGRRPGQGLILELAGIRELTRREFAGLLSSLTTAMETGSARCRIRLVCDSEEVRALFRTRGGLDFAACATADEALRSLEG